MRLSKIFHFAVFIFTVTFSRMFIITGVSADETTPPSQEVKLESQDLEVLQKNDSSSLNDSPLLSYRFQCIVNGLSKAQLEKLTSEDDDVDGQIVINVYGVENGSDNERRPYNITLKAINDSLIITGEIRRNKNETLENVKTEEGSSLPIRSCDVIFLDSVGEGSQGSSVVANPGTGKVTPPEIVTEYNHVVLMHGAPDQILSCVAEGQPRPQMKWLKNGRNETLKSTLSKDAESSTGDRSTSYLLFTKVTSDTPGNYTCIAENEFGRATKTFEVEVISVEAINLECNEVNKDVPQSPSVPSSGISNSGSRVIFSQNIYEILHRSKRNLWYQWRGQKIYIPPFNRPPGPTLPQGPTTTSTNRGGTGMNSDMQKLVNFIAERLRLADKVAVNKWDNNLPVEDGPREQIILANMVRLAENRGLDGAWAHLFFRDQIEANKDIQYELLRIWRLQGRRPPGPPVDLRNEVRPQIDLINGKMIELAKRTESERRVWNCPTEVEKNARYATFLFDLDPLHQKALQRATRNVCTVKTLDQYPGFGAPIYPL